MKKRLLTLVLAAAMVLGMGTTVFAEGEVTPSTQRTENLITKEYKTSTEAEAQAPAVIPTETLSFKVNVTTDKTNPDDTMISVANYNAAATGTLTITIPAYDTVGTYYYTITETAGSSQGVTYANNSIDVQVLASYNDNHTAIETEIVLSKLKTGSTTAKEDTFTNIYNVGTLAVTKNTTGNQADREKQFPIKVTFTTTTGKTVNNDITYNDGTDATIEKGWTGTKEVTINVKNQETVTFNNIPVGVTYVVEEVGVVDGKLGDYTVSYDSNKTGTISTTASATTVTNDYDLEINTGIIINNIPYIVALVAVAAVAVVLFRRKREF